MIVEDNFLDDFLGELKLPQASVPLTARTDLLGEYAKLQIKYEESLRDSDDSLAGSRSQGIKDQMYELEDRMAASVRHFVFEALPHQKYDKLLAQHPPKEADRKALTGFNRETFPIALIAACSHTPKMSPSQVDQLVNRLTDGQFGKLWNTVITLNVGDDVPPKSVRHSSLVEEAKRSSITASLGESPEASSSDE